MTDVSVVVPTFRREAQLVEAIESVLAQGVSTEVFVLDDSPEGSAQTVVTKYASRGVSYIKQDIPSGGCPAYVRNSAWPRATGRLVHFLDDDDRVVEGYYRDALAMFDAHPQIGMVFGRIEPFSAGAGSAMQHENEYFSRAARKGRWLSRFGTRYMLVASLLFHPTVLVNSACIVRRECIKQLDGYDVALGLNEDVDFFCRVARKYDYGFLDRVVVHYRINHDSLMHGREDNHKLVDAYKRMHQRYREAHGTLEYLMLKVLARTVLRVM